MDIESGDGASAAAAAIAASEEQGADADLDSSWARHFAQSVAKKGGGPSGWGAMR